MKPRAGLETGSARYSVEAELAACLRSVPASTLLANSPQLFPSSGPTRAPIINGTTLTTSPGAAFASGHFNRVPTIIGVARDEKVEEFYNRRRLYSTLGYRSAEEAKYHAAPRAVQRRPPRVAVHPRAAAQIANRGAAQACRSRA
jgi:hypothetical protein